MMKVQKQLFYFILLTLFSHTCFAQLFTNNIVFDTTQFTPKLDSVYHLHINKVTIVGNKKTKDYIILREAQLKQGDSILTENLYAIIEQARLNVYNTTLFNEVKINTIAIDAFTIDIQIEVKERWYVFPTPQFKLVDRSLTEWIKTYDADLRRVIYGVKFAHYNISGRRDQLRFYLLNGYSRGFAASYTAPYSNKQLTQGFSVGVSFAQGREINYATSYQNKLLFFSTKSVNDSLLKSFVSKSFSLNTTFRLRKGIFNTHVFGLGYTNLKISDSIPLKYNPNYFGKPTSTIGFLDFTYNYQHINVNNVAYPLTGKTAYLAVLKRGVGFSGGINMLAFDMAYNKFFNLGKNWYFSNGTSAAIKLPFKQAYINQQGIGYGGAFLRGLELYAVNGVAYALNKATLKKKLASFKVRLPFGIPFLLKKNEKIPFTFFAKTYADVGYNYNENTPSFLSNKFLYTTGFGIDMLTFYDFNIRFEYSFNQLHEKGLFLRVQSGF